MALNLDKVLTRIGSMIEAEAARDKLPPEKKVPDPGIERAGTKIILPSLPQPMPIMTAIGALLRYLEDEETLMDTFEIIRGYPMDVAVAFNKAMKEIYGWSSPVATPGFWGDRPPTLVTVKTGPGPDDKLQVPWGSFKLPNIENIVQVAASADEDGPYVNIHGKVRKRERSVLVELAALTREFLKAESIYKGRALQLSPDSQGELNQMAEPKFFDSKGGANLILNPDEEDQIKTALWAPIQYTDECVRNGIPLKRGILLEGSYGLGKTLTARETARICTENGWTFIMLDDVRALSDALIFARQFEPAVVFAEDIDRLVDEDRDQEANDLLNTIDGVLSKDAKVITVLTTNDVDKINKAMLRPGRFDAVVRMKPPQGDAVKRLITLYGRGLIRAGETFDQVAELLSGHSPATIREVVERSKLAMIAGDRDQVTEHDLIISTNIMQGHLDLLKDRPAKSTPEQRLGEALGEVIHTANGLDKMEAKVERIDKSVQAIEANIVG